MRAAVPSLLGFCLLAAASGCSTPRYSLVRSDSAWWLADPEGRRFFSLGVCVVDRGIPAGDYDPAAPAYSAARHYPDAAAWAEAALARLRSWGFTTIGGWSDAAALGRSASMDLALAPVLGAGMEAGVPWFDL